MTTTDVRRLVLLRHAKTARPPAVADHARQLTSRGRRDAAEAGRRLAGGDLVPDLVLCSGAVRAVETWRAVAGQLDAVPRVAVEARLYEASAASVVDLVAESGGHARTVLVVGHEPTMSAVAEGLAGPGSDGGLLADVRAGLPTSGIAVLEHAGPWSALQARSCALTALVTPRAAHDADSGG